MARVVHEPCHSQGDCYHARGGRIGGRIGGRTQGRKNVESGHIQRIATSESCAKGGYISGRIQGRKNVESGHLQRISSLGGRIGGRRHIELYGSPATLESCAKGGRIGGRKNVQSGQLAEARKKANVVLAANPEIRREAGRKAVESGQLARISKGVPSTADGILFRSQTEASFYCVMKELGGEPVYEPNVIKLSDGTSYTPDFVLGKSVLDIPANIPIELKPARNAYYNGNLEKAIQVGASVIYWNELEEAGGL